MRIILLYALVILASSSCTTTQHSSADSKPLIVATTGMIGDAVKSIAGDSFEVVSLMGPGVDPHLYKATQGDMDLLLRADIIFYNGLHLEGKMGEVFEKLGRTKDVIAVSKDVPKDRLLKVPEFDNNYDPHIWFDLSLWKHTLPVISGSLAQKHPDFIDLFNKNEQKYSQMLDSLHLWAITEIEKIPTESRVLITAHDAFGYFGKAYNMEVKGLQGISTLSEFGMKDRIDLAQLIIDRKIKALFIETSVPVRAINSVIESVKDKGFEVNIGGSLYSDAMGNPGTPEGTFKGMFISNINTITQALK